MPPPESAGAPRRVALAGLVVLALLASGEGATTAFPVEAAIEVRPGEARVSVDGAERVVATRLGVVWERVALEAPGPAEREYQLDGTDTTATQDRDVAHVRAIQASPLYAAAAWLRDEASYSRWERLRLRDLTSGATLAEGQAAVERTPLPVAFRLEAALRRPEAAARLWLVAADGAREGLELERDRRSARWLRSPPGNAGEPARWFFPEQPAPFAAALVQLAGRAAAAGFATLILALAAARGLALCPDAWASAWRRGAGGRPACFGTSACARRRAGAVRVTQAPADRWIALALVGAWLAAATWVTVRLYRQLPHVLDAVSYVFQAKVLAAGRLWLEAPPAVAALEGPFQVVWDGRWFSQYPPGAPLAYAAGSVVGLTWLVGPIAGAALLLATALAARALFSRSVALAALGLGVISPFILFQAGSFLSHPIAGGLLAGALAAFSVAERTGRARAYAWAGLALGAAFATREAATLLFALPLVAWLALHRRWRALGWLALAGGPFIALYAAYNTALTGSPLLLPRFLFDPSDRFGFGDGVGFYGRHTLAAGLANADELLTLLQFDLFGWPPLFALGLLGLPFLLGQADRRDALLAGGALLFVAVYVAYFYHGVALGPRYYYEALPWLLLLASRALQAMVVAIRRLDVPTAAARAGVAAVVALLSLNTFLYYLPRQVERRADFTALPSGRRLALPFVQATLAGPRLVGLERPALVVTDDWWIYTVVLAPLNCARLDQADLDACPGLFARASGTEAERTLQRQYPGRVLLRAVERDGTLQLEPADAAAP